MQVIDLSGICNMDVAVERQVSKHGDVFTASCAVAQGCAVYEPKDGEIYNRHPFHKLR